MPQAGASCIVPLACGHDTVVRRSRCEAADVIRFLVTPAADELPARFPSPFDRAAVHPVAVRAAIETQVFLQRAEAAAWQLESPGGGKMLGVLVVQSADGDLGYLRGFSGMMAGRWDVEGWVPPAFDRAAHDAIWLSGDAEMRAFSVQRAALESHGDVTAVQALDDARSARSRLLLPQLQAAYRLSNARGEVRALHDLFAPRLPPGGAGDCAAPKLLAAAYRAGLRPVAMAEFWCGAPPRSGDRRNRSFYPACHGKCAPILAHMLTGLEADAAPVYGSGAISADEPRVVYEDAQLVIVDKPTGLLSVPGRGGLRQDCVSTRLRARFPGAMGQLVVHRLDLDTSGLLLAAKDPVTFVALQRLFSRREVTKRYIAWLDGDVHGEHGVIELPLRTDIDDRPRQVHDAVHGKVAVTSWRVLSRRDGRTRVELMPHTGRTHQLRVHAAHPAGLDTPIVGDRLYGTAAPAAGERLMLHAESLAFVHPATGQPMLVEAPAPF